MVKVSVVYKGGLRCEATHGPSGEKLLTDAPVDNRGQGAAFSPTDLVATALATCVATIVGIAAEEHGWRLEGMRVEVSKEMAPDEPRRIGTLRLVIVMPIRLSDEDRKQVEYIAHHSPVHRSLHPEINCAAEVHWPAA